MDGNVGPVAETIVPKSVKKKVVKAPIVAPKARIIRAPVRYIPESARTGRSYTRRASTRAPVRAPVRPAVRASARRASASSASARRASASSASVRIAPIKRSATERRSHTNKGKVVVTEITLAKGVNPPAGYARLRNGRRGVVYRKVNKTNMNALANEFAKLSGIGKTSKAIKKHNALTARNAKKMADNDNANNEAENENDNNKVDKLASVFGKTTLQTQNGTK